MSKRKMSEWMREWWITILALLLVVGLPFAIYHFHEGLLRSLSEAFFLASFLTVTVDPFIKKRLAKDVSRDVFHHLLGFDLPEEIKLRLRDFLFQNKNYRADLEISAHATRVSDSEVQLEVEVRSTVVAIAPCDYPPLLAFEESEKPTVINVSVTSDGGGTNFCENNIAVPDKDDEPMVREWKGTPIPLSRGDRRKTFFKFTVMGQTTDFWTHNFGATTINPRVRVSADEGLEIFASKPDIRNGNEYVYNRVFVPGDHIQIRWRPMVAAST